MELSAHACILRRAERDSVANEAERGNSILGRAATIGSSVSNSTFKTTEECLKKLEGDLQERSVDTDEITKVTGIATSLGDEFVAEMNMWYGAKELASRWCFGRTIFAQTPLSFYQLPLLHLFEADIHTYIKAGKKDKDSLERFDWIRQNFKWYNDHATISPGGYYEERRVCGDPNCCGTRMLPLPPLKHQNHQQPTSDIRGTKGCGKDDESLATKITSLNLFTEIPVDEGHYQEMDYFLPSKALEVIFTNRHGFTEEDVHNFQVVLPCAGEGLQEEIRKLSEKEKAKERRKNPISLRDKLSPDKLHNETVTRLTDAERDMQLWRRRLSMENNWS